MLVSHCKLGTDERTCGVNIKGLTNQDMYGKCKDCKHFELIPMHEVEMSRGQLKRMLYEGYYDKFERSKSCL